MNTLKNLAEKWDKSNSPLQNQYINTIYSNTGLEDLLQWVPPHAQQVLDIGCGAGDNARLLSQRGLKIHGVTLSESEAKLAKRYTEEMHVADISTWIAPLCRWGI